jgi:hypothetical protein
MSEDAGNGRVGEEPVAASGGDVVFPFRESVKDGSGSQRWFLIDHRVNEGANRVMHAVTANEEDCDGLGFSFTAYSETGAHEALGRVREKMHRTLAMRHITRSESGYRMLHDTLRGRIEAIDEGKIVLVVDGIHLSLEDLRKVLVCHEGWQFRLQIVDPGDDLA